MTISTFIERVRRLAKKPPGYLLHRLAREGRMSIDRLLAPWQARQMTGQKLARMTGVSSVDELWRLLADRPYPAAVKDFAAQEFSIRFPEARAAILQSAEDAIVHRVDLLGTGPVDHGARIDWLVDVKSGDHWPPAFCRSIDYLNKGRPSDVKVPWELSRLQWLLPVGQAFLLTGDARYAACARDVLEQWIEANPFAWTVNWSCTMEPALRILSWTWLFHVFADAPGWDEPRFRSRFLATLYLHGQFTAIHIERSTINGNHLTADACGLVFAGLFFRGIGQADGWQTEGWRTLEHEIALQVHPDGVDFEASSAYHRLVAELFLLPARYRLAVEEVVPSAYTERLALMGHFAAAYTRPDGSSPNWGDADDGRALPLGTQMLGDHRYLIGLIALTVGDPSLLAAEWGTGDEIAWHAGLNSLALQMPTQSLGSSAFREGGVYILRNRKCHVFIDCGPLGLAGLGGHGHNDALSFEAWLGGAPVIVDPGSFVYTASFEDRNLFRSTAMHNTPQVDGEEVNRFVSLDNLWNLHDDARAEAGKFEPSTEGGRFVGHHFGYERLVEPVGVNRVITLDGEHLTITDTLSGSGTHGISIPLHFAPGIEITSEGVGSWRLEAEGGRTYRLSFVADTAFDAVIEDVRISPSYGVALAAKRLVWRAKALLPISASLSITALPADGF